MKAPGWPRQLTLGSRVIEVRTAKVGEPGALTGGESALEARGKNEKRRTEFRAGRIAARAAVGAVLGPASEQFEVLAQPDGAADAGRPVVVPACGLSLSVSHASGLAVAVAARGAPLGVDLEAAALSVEPSFAQEAFADGELERWAFTPAPLPFAWAAKEAMLKAWGVGLRAPLGLVSLVPRVTRSEERSFFLQIEIAGTAAPEGQRRFEGWAGVIDAWVMVVLQHSG